MREGLRPLVQALDRHVIGHQPVKDAILLALVSREHLYLEGPPGTAKTRLAELTASLAGLPFFFYQLHRDTRLSELVGDIVLERHPVEGGGERIHQQVEPGGILKAEVCVLDDISRAPGEALNILLRLLGERKFGERAIPLRTAIATSNPHSDDYYNEPLDPANLDRFALQLRVSPLLGGADPDAARTLLDRFADGDVEERPEPAPCCSAALFDELFAELPRIELPQTIRDSLLEVLRILTVEYDCNEENSLLTDRSFLVKAVKLLRARALLRGRKRVELNDLEILRSMTTFRVPSSVHEELPAVIDRAAQAQGTRSGQPRPRGKQ